MSQWIEVNWKETLWANSWIYEMPLGYVKTVSDRFGGISERLIDQSQVFELHCQVDCLQSTPPWPLGQEHPAPWHRLLFFNSVLTTIDPSLDRTTPRLIEPLIGRLNDRPIIRSTNDRLCDHSIHRLNDWSIEWSIAGSPNAAIEQSIHR